MKRKLTERQREIFSFVRKHIERFSIPPTRQEIAYEFGFRSTNAAQCHLEAIEAKGWLHIVRGNGVKKKVSRGILLA